MADKSFFIDTTKCTACRGCQVACKQWNKLPATNTYNWGSFQNPADLSFDTFKLVRFAVLSGPVSALPGTALQGHRRGLCGWGRPRE